MGTTTHKHKHPSPKSYTSSHIRIRIYIDMYMYIYERVINKYMGLEYPKKSYNFFHYICHITSSSNWTK